MLDLRTLLGNNEFLSGGLVLGAFASAIALLKIYGMRAVRWAWSRAVITVEVRDSEPCFQWLLIWLDRHPYAKRARRLSVSIAHSGGAEAPSAVGSDPKRPVYIFSPAVGSHLLWYAGKLLWIDRSRRQQPSGLGGSSEERETFTVTLFAKTQDVVRQLLEDAFDAYLATVREQSRVFTTYLGYWRTAGLVRERPLDSVILPGHEKEDLLADIRTFLASETWYHERGIPYRRGYLLQGVPGSGKSSLVAALAGEIGVHLYVVDPGSMRQRDLQECMGNISSPRAIILFEDIDSARAAKARTDEQKKQEADSDAVTLSGLLNALDGVASRDGYITIMTTNRRSVLDPALTRPGRIDREVEFGYATRDQAEALYRRFYGVDAPGPLVVPDNTSMATLQEHFLRHRNDPVAGAALRQLAAPSLEAVA